MEYQVDKLTKSKHELNCIANRSHDISVIKERLSISTYEKIDRLFSKRGITQISFGDEELNTEFDIDTILIEAAIYFCYSLFDVVLNILNNEIVPQEKKLKARDVTYSKIRKIIDSTVLLQLKSIYDSYEYQYFKGFTNISKHRGIIKRGTRVISSNKKTGPIIKEFEYEGSVFEESCWTEVFDRIESFYKSIIEMLGFLNTRNSKVKYS
jgi:hypothetical protein